MFKRALALALLLQVVWPLSLRSAELFPAVSGDADARIVTIYSSLDAAAARPLVAAFQADNPDIAVNYHELQTLEIYERVIRETDDEGRTADLIISSAMDLQMKLANDGYARRIAITSTDGWPDWANWRDTAFALTFEPAVIVYHGPSFAGADVPRTRAGLMAFLEDNADRVFGRVATYDIERAGLGFLFLARDEAHYRDTWALVRSMGAAGVKLYSNSSAILERVADGRFVLGYNILGSYANAWAEHDADLQIVLPSDYTIIMSRIAMVPAVAASPDLGQRVLEFLMSRRGQQAMAQDAKLPALHPDVTGPNTASAIRREAGDQLRPISVSPGLLVYLDQVKRARFIEQWNEALRER